MRTAQKIEENKAKIAEGKDSRGRARKGYNPKSRNNLRPYPKGVSGNPGGLPGTDLAAQAARRFFEEHPEIADFELPKGFNAYAFSVLADRGYGKLKEKHEVSVTGELAVRLEAARRRVKKNGETK